MDGDETRAERAAQTMRGLPQTLHSGYTPLGEIEQASKIADGLGVARQGWRKVVFRVGVGLIAAATLTTLVLGIYSQSHR